MKVTQPFRKVIDQDVLFSRYQYLSSYRINTKRLPPWREPVDGRQKGFNDPPKLFCYRRTLNYSAADIISVSAYAASVFFAKRSATNQQIDVSGFAVFKGKKQLNAGSICTYCPNVTYPESRSHLADCYDC